MFKTAKDSNKPNLLFFMGTESTLKLTGRKSTLKVKTEPTMAKLKAICRTLKKTLPY